MMQRQKLFGTDGIRGGLNASFLTVDLVLRLGQALGILARENAIGFSCGGHRKRIAIGKDTRISGYAMEQALASGIVSAGVDVMLLGPMPTPGIAFITESMRADAGVSISASHNPYYDNGLKIFDHRGFKLVPELEARIESMLQVPFPMSKLASGEEVGRAFRVDDAVGRYVVYLKSMVMRHRSLDGLRVVLDCAHGAGYKVGPAVFRELGAEVIEVGCSPNGLNINDQVGSVYPKRMCEEVIKSKAHLGIALDGDADRVLFADEHGRVIHGEHVIGALALHLYAQRQLAKNTVVSTVLSNMALDRFLERHDMLLERTPVGDKHLVERMLARQASFGGEESGHLIFLNHGTTGDGLLAALCLVDKMVQEQSSLSLLHELFALYPQVKCNIALDPGLFSCSLEKTGQMVAEYNRQFSGRGRVLLRKSGTEPVLRLLTEHECEADAKKAMEAIVQAVHADFQATRVSSEEISGNNFLR